MSKFKIGDKIRCICGNMSHILKKDKVYTVAGYGSHGVKIEGTYENGSSVISGVSETLFEKVKTSTKRTSIEANKKVKRASIKDHIIIELLFSPHGMTGTEIAERTTLRLNSITPRFAELQRELAIKDSGQRRDGQIVWVLA